MSVFNLFIENPTNPNIGDTIQFENREQMDVYIEGERRYTKKELIALYKAISINDREKAKQKLRSARFAYLSEIIKAVADNNEAG